MHHDDISDDYSHDFPEGGEEEDLEIDDLIEPEPIRIMSPDIIRYMTGPDGPANEDPIVVSDEDTDANQVEDPGDVPTISHVHDDAGTQPYGPADPDFDPWPLLSDLLGETPTRSSSYNVPFYNFAVRLGDTPVEIESDKDSEATLPWYT